MENQHIITETKPADEAVQLYADYIENTYQTLTNLGNENKQDVLLVKQKGSGRIAVKKRILPECTQIYQEIKDINHPNIVKIYEVCSNRENSVAVEEFISGETLEQKLKAGRLTKKKAVKYCVQILNGLEQLHARGIIHRDITPSNVLISSDDVVKLTDFGISRYRKQQQERDTEILGTVGYAAPEQFGFQQTDTSADLYSLGVMLNVMLTGKLPAERFTENKRLGRIVKRCIRMEPDKRYKTAQRMRQDLQGKFICQNIEDASIFPGFRSDITWRKVSASVAYMMMGVYSFTSIVSAASNSFALLLELCSLLLFWMIFFVGSNFGRWDEWLFPFPRLPKGLRISIRIVICFILFFYAIDIDNYVRYVILPRS